MEKTAALAQAGLDWQRRHRPPNPAELAPRSQELPPPGRRVRVWYHGENCRDGFGAAYAAWKALGDRAIYTPVEDRETPPEHSAGDTIYILDFSYPRDVLVDLDKEVADLVVIDHHDSAERQLQGLKFAIFDQSHSGAVLAWNYFHPGTPVPELLLYVEDRDLWAWKLEQSREASYAMRSYPLGDFELWEAFDLETLKAEGEHIRRYAERAIEEDAISKAFLLDIGGAEFQVVNSPMLRSEIPDALVAADASAAATYADSPGGRSWSLRSDGSVNVARIAESLGGGGHPAAAGFREEVPGEKVEITWPVERP